MHINKISLKDWMFDVHSQEEYQNLFYGLHSKCHTLYESFDMGVPSLDVRNSNQLGKVLEKIQLNWTNARDITYLDTVPVPLEDRVQAKQINIDFLVTFAIGVYLDYGFQNGLLNHDLIEAEFDQIKPFLPQDDVPYYEDVVIHHNYIFYDEWYQNKSKSPQERGIQLVKGGTGHSNSNIDIDNYEKAAFAQSTFLTVSFFAVAITVMLIVFLLLK